MSTRLNQHSQNDEKEEKKTQRKTIMIIYFRLFDWSQIVLCDDEGKTVIRATTRKKNDEKKNVFLSVSSKLRFYLLKNPFTSNTK